jgi:hypothetical protein
MRQVSVVSDKQLKMHVIQRIAQLNRIVTTRCDTDIGWVVVQFILMAVHTKLSATLSRSPRNRRSVILASPTHASPLAGSKVASAESSESIASVGSAGSDSSVTESAALASATAADDRLGSANASGSDDDPFFMDAAGVSVWLCVSGSSTGT